MKEEEDIKGKSSNSGSKLGQFEQQAANAKQGRRSTTIWKELVLVCFADWLFDLVFVVLVHLFLLDCFCFA